MKKTIMISSDCDFEVEYVGDTAYIDFKGNPEEIDFTIYSTLDGMTKSMKDGRINKSGKLELE